MTVAEMQKMKHDVIRHLLSEDGSDIQIVDGQLCEISARRIDNETLSKAVKRVLGRQGNDDHS